MATLLPLLLLLPLPASAINKSIGINFTVLPESRVAPPGDLVFFHCRTNIRERQQIRWLHNGNRLDEQTKHIKIGDGKLTIKMRTRRRHHVGQTGRYQCVAGLEGRLLMSPPATLAVAHLDSFLEKTDLPSTMVANAGNTLLLPCQVPASNPPAIVQWERDGALLNMTGELIRLVSDGSLLIQNLRHDQAGSYACRASNHLTAESLLSPHPLRLSVLPEAELHKPRLLTEPANEYHGVQGGTLTLPCSASGSPKPTIMWEHEAYNQQPVVVHQEGPSELLQLTNLTANSSGKYSCKIWNNRGRLYLRKTLVFVAEKPRAEISSFSPGPHREGGALELYCRAEGFPVPKVYWVFNGVRQHLGYSDQDTAKLLITSLRLSDAGIYQCFAENKAGVATDAALVGVVPAMREPGEGEERPHREQQGGRRRGGQRPEKVKPSAPNVTQLSQDSVSIVWTMVKNTTVNIAFFKVQHRDLGLKNKDSSCPRGASEMHQTLNTVDGEIAANIRTYEIPGLLKDHCYRFKVSAVFEDHDQSNSKFSKRFKMETKHEAPPGVIPLVTDILNISDTSLSINWEIAATKHEITGYFILFREGTSAGSYSRLTIFGDATHSHILDNLKPGTNYDIKVRAFNMNGEGKPSKVRYGRTNGSSKKKNRRKKKKQTDVAGKQEGDGEEVKDRDAALYLTIGVSLALVCILGLGGCSVATCLQRRRRSDKFSDSNAAIHSKYQDTSLQITGQQQEQENQGLEEAMEWRTGDAGKLPADTSTESGVHETSFSVSPTDHSYDGLDNSSQGSTALAQDQSRGNLNYTASPPPLPDRSLESLTEEYTDEPSRGWKRRRRSEEIL